MAERSGSHIYSSTIYCLYIFSGAIKAFFDYYGLFFDITVFFGILLILEIFYSLPEKSISSLNLGILASVLIFYLWILFSLIYTDSPGYSYKKSYLYLLNILALSYPLISKINIKFLLKLISYLALPFSFWFIIMKTIHYSSYKYLIDMDAFYPIRDNYLGFGMITGLAIIYFYYNRKYILFMVSIVATLGLGARAALVLSLITIIPLFVTRIRSFNLSISKKYLYLTPVVVAIATIFYARISYFINSGLLRFLSLFDLANDNPTSVRLEHYNFAINHIISSPLTFFFGEGIGSYGIILSGTDTIEYPHNIVLEVWFELGLVGVILFSTSILMTLIIKSSLLMKMIFIFFLLNAMKSQQLSGLRMLYGVMGLALTSSVKAFSYDTK